MQWSGDGLSTAANRSTRAHRRFRCQRERLCGSADRTHRVDAHARVGARRAPACRIRCAAPVYSRLNRFSLGTDFRSRVPPDGVYMVVSASDSSGGFTARFVSSGAARVFYTEPIERGGAAVGRPGRQRAARRGQATHRHAGASAQVAACASGIGRTRRRRSAGRHRVDHTQRDARDHGRGVADANLRDGRALVGRACRPHHSSAIRIVRQFAATASAFPPSAASCRFHPPPSDRYSATADSACSRRTWLSASESRRYTSCADSTSRKSVAPPL